MADVVVIGGGAAALRACLAAAGRGARVTLIAKGRAGGSGCTRALDSRIEFSVVNAPMASSDMPSTYAADLEAVGQGIKAPERVQLFAERSSEELALLERLGVFAPGGRRRRVQLAGSSQPRGVVCPERFGARVLGALWAATPRERVTVLERTMALDVLAAEGRAVGVVVLDLPTGAVRVVPADAVVLAAGGGGALFSLTTNPRDLCGDGFALARRAGAALDHMEFIQYVMLTVAPIRGYFLLTSVLLRGALVDETGARFDPGGDVARLTPVEQKRRLADFMAWPASRQRSAPGLRVFWDGRALGSAAIAAAMPKTCAAFLRRGHDLGAAPVEIGLGAHQFLGGVVTDLEARSGVPNLFAAGDVADSIQGADRLNGSGVMEALVFGAIAGGAAAGCPALGAAPALPAAYARTFPHPAARIQGWRRGLARLMDEVLVVRDRARLERLEPELAADLAAIDEGGLLGETPATTRALHELRSAVTTAVEVVRASRRRGHDLGLFLTGAAAGEGAR
jgi:succinate dehydrogenase/fumarate reductase flavoprotein subunit